MKIKDLPPNKNLGGLKVRTTDGRVGYWASQWQKGVWLSENADRNGRVYPIVVKDLEDSLEWDIVDEEVEVNLKESKLS